MPSRSKSSQELLWSTVHDITTKARACDKESRDEMAWSMDVNMPVFNLDTTNINRFSRLEYMYVAFHLCTVSNRTEMLFSQTQTIDETCLQMYDDRVSQGKKADFALSFSPQHPDIRTHYDQLKTPGHERPTLSQMSDICTSHLGLYIGAVVREPGGNENEAKGQLFTWLGSGVIKQRQLLSQNTPSQPVPEIPMPLVGYTIVGYRWEFYVAYGQGNKATDDIYILGPLPELNIGTSSYLEAFRLLQFDERVKKWAKDICWPWFRDKIMEPLKPT